MGDGECGLRLTNVILCWLVGLDMLVESQMVDV